MLGLMVIWLPSSDALVEHGGVTYVALGVVDALFQSKEDDQHDGGKNSHAYKHVGAIARDGIAVLKLRLLLSQLLRLTLLAGVGCDIMGGSSQLAVADEVARTVVYGTHVGIFGHNACTKLIHLVGVVAVEVERGATRRIGGKAHRTVVGVAHTACHGRQHLLTLRLSQDIDHHDRAITWHTVFATADI